VSRSSFALLACCLLTACAQTVTSGTAPPDAAVTPADVPVIATDAPAPPDAPAPVDAGPAVVPDGGVSDDCRAGTWCWERPFPTGEVAVAAVAPSADRMAFVTEGGTLARWESGRWSTQVLTLPGQPTGVWLGDNGEVVLTVVERLSQRARWIVELRGGTQRVVALEGEGYVSDPRSTGDTLWVKGTREIYRRRGGAMWETIDGPGSDAIIASYHVVGPDEVIALESWGSGSGTGLLHRYRAGAWELAVDFRERSGYRVEGPIAEHDGALWMRTFEVGSGLPGVVRVVGSEVEDLRVPRGLRSMNLYAVGTQVWLVDGNRAWRRQGDEWVSVAGFPGRAYGVMAGFGDGVAWVLSEGVHRFSGGAWQRVAEGDQPTGNLWDVGGEPLLVSYRPSGFLALRAGMRPSWALEPMMLQGEVTGDAPPVQGVGALATDEGVMRVMGRAVGRLVPWPERGLGRVMSASPAGTWAWLTTDRFIGLTGDAWTEITGPVFEDVPRAGYNVDAVHFTADGRLFVAASLVTGDKQVRRRVYLREGEAWRLVVSEMGVFGRTESAFIAGDRSDDVWIGLSGLHHFTGMTASLVAPALDVQSLARRSDGAVVALTMEAVETYGADERRLDRVLLPAVRAYFSRVHQVAATRVLRVANGSGHVMRYTP